MARRARKRMIQAEVIDATPERIAKDPSIVIPVEVESAGDRLIKTRRFRTAHLDRLYHASKLSWPQFYAGDWYRNQHHASRFGLSLVASYGERVASGEPSYGLPRTEAQARARQAFRAARAVIPNHMVGFVDRILLHDEMPPLRNRAARRTIAEFAKALDFLVVHLMLPSERLDVAARSA